MPKKTDMRPPIQAPKGTLLRVIKLLFKDYPVHLSVVAVCLLISAVSATLPSLFMNRTIQMVEEGLAIGKVSGWEAGLAAVAPGIGRLTLVLLCVYAVALTCSFTYHRLMAIVTQGFLHKMQQALLSLTANQLCCLVLFLRRQ